MEAETKSRIKKSAALAAIVVASIATYEGLRTVAYRDPVGIPTVCFGETRGVHLGDRYTADECKTMLGDRLVEFELQIRKCLVAPDKIPDKSYAATISLAYNVGVGAFCKSSIARYENLYGKTGNFSYLSEACDRFRLYNKAGGRVLPGLVRRRNDERKMCLEGVREKRVTGLIEGDDQ